MLPLNMSLVPQHMCVQQNVKSEPIFMTTSLTINSLGKMINCIAVCMASIQGSWGSATTALLWHVWFWF